MPINLRRISAPLFLGLSTLATAQAGPPLTPIDQAQQQVVTYLGKLADLHCTEEVVQQKLKPNGDIEASLRSQFDYFLLMQGGADDFQLSESRLETAEPGKKKVSLLLTNGFSTLLLVFHPYYRNSFEFTVGSLQLLNGKSVIPIHFAHVSGTRSPAALALRGREFPLDLEGTAWLDANSRQVVRIDANLPDEMTDVGLRSLEVHVEYMPSLKPTDHFMLPSLAVVDLKTPRQHWRNTHSFHDYKLFSTDAVQDPNVKLHDKDAQKEPQTPTTQMTSEVKEKP